MSDEYFKINIFTKLFIIQKYNISFYDLNKLMKTNKLTLKYKKLYTSKKTQIKKIIESKNIEQKIVKFHWKTRF